MDKPISDYVSIVVFTSDTCERCKKFKHESLPSLRILMQNMFHLSVHEYPITSANKAKSIQDGAIETVDKLASGAVPCIAIVENRFMQDTEDFWASYLNTDVIEDGIADRVMLKSYVQEGLRVIISSIRDDRNLR